MSSMFREFPLSRFIIYISRNLRNIKSSFDVIIGPHFSKRAEEKVKLIRSPIELSSSSSWTVVQKLVIMATNSGYYFLTACHMPSTIYTLS